MTVPNDFCDFEALKTVGHEAMHAAGFGHAGEYQYYNWRGSDGEACAFTATPKRLP